MPILAIGREIDRIAIMFERRFELVAKGRFVFDNQDAHRNSFRFAA
jgi:hypothetical protein